MSGLRASALTEQELLPGVFYKLPWRYQYLVQFICFVVIIAYNHFITFQPEVQRKEEPLSRKAAVHLGLACIIHLPQAVG